MFDLLIKKPESIKNDLLSGLTVSLALIPEAIAFSFVAHVDPTIGLYAAFMMGLITAVFGGRPGMISGATGAVAIIFAPLVIAQTALHGMDTAIGMLFLAVILMGVIQIIFGVCRLGKLIRLIPHPVMLGFVNGLALIIFKAQLSQFYIGTGDEATLLSAAPLTIMLGLIGITMLITHFLPRFTKVIPASLAAIVCVTGLSALAKSFGLDVYTVIDFVQNMDPSKTSISASLPVFAIPNVPLTWATFMLILPTAVLAASVGLIESLMTLTLVDELTETRGSGNKESIGQGLANVVNGFFGGMGGCAMIGQSMINIRAGGRGRLSGIAAALCLLFFILFGSALIEMIPLAALVGIMFMVVIGTFEWSSFRILKKIPKSDAFVLIVVSAVTVFVDLAIAVLVGIVISALVFAWEQGKHMHSENSVNKEGHKVYGLKGTLFFGSITSFKGLFQFTEDPDHVVLNFKHTRICDHSAIEAIQMITQRYRKLDKTVQFKFINKGCLGLLKKADGLVDIPLKKP